MFMEFFMSLHLILRIYVAKTRSDYICAHISLNLGCIFSICFTSCNVIKPAHVYTGPASEAAFASLLHGGDDAPHLEGDSWVPRPWETCLVWHHPLLFLIRRWKKNKSGKSARFIMQFGCKPRVFALGFFSSFTGYANISTYSFYCTRRGFGSPSLC